MDFPKLQKTVVLVNTMVARVQAASIVVVQVQIISKNYSIFLKNTFHPLGWGGLEQRIPHTGFSI